MLALLVLAAAVFAVNIANCAELNVAYSTYDLTANIVNSLDIDACMNITANNIILDCHSFTVDGLDAVNTYGVLVGRGVPIQTNITIKNCPITDWNRGIWLNNTGNDNITNTSANSNTAIGIYLFTLHNATITNITANNNWVGFGLVSSSNNSFYNNIASNNGNGGINLELDSSNNTFYGNIVSNNPSSGFFIDSSSNNILYNNTINNNTAEGITLLASFYNETNNTIYNNIISNSGTYGIYFEYSSPILTYTENNSIFNNLFNNTNNFRYCDYDVTYTFCLTVGTAYIIPNSWNTTSQVGTRIFSTGTNISGNYWTNPTGTGHSDTCADTDKNGFCDLPYDVMDDNTCTSGGCSNNTDYLALSSQYLAPSSGGIPNGGGGSTTGIGATASNITNITSAFNLNLDQSVDLAWLGNIFASIKNAVFWQYGKIPFAFVLLFICTTIVYFDINKKGSIGDYGKIAGVLGILLVLIYIKVI